MLRICLRPLFRIAKLALPPLPPRKSSEARQTARQTPTATLCVGAASAIKRPDKCARSVQHSIGPEQDPVRLPTLDIFYRAALENSLDSDSIAACAHNKQLNFCLCRACAHACSRHRSCCASNKRQPINTKFNANQRIDRRGGQAHSRKPANPFDANRLACDCVRLCWLLAALNNADRDLFISVCDIYMR